MMANSMAQHKVQGVLKSLDKLLFCLTVHNDRAGGLSEEMKEMCGDSQYMVYSAIKKYADHHLGAGPDTNDQIGNLERYMVHLKQANFSLRAEIHKLQNKDDAINGLCNVMGQMIDQLNQQHGRDKKKFDGDGFKDVNQPPEDNSDKDGLGMGEKCQ